MEPRLRKLVVRSGEDYINIAITHIQREENVVFAYLGDTLVGFWV